MLQAMLAEPLEARDLAYFINDDRYSFEQKLDGHRLLVETDGHRVLTAYNRDGALSQHSPWLQTRTWSHNARIGRRAIFDGEFLDGQLHIFDLLELDGIVSYHHQQRQRRGVLETLFEKVDFNERFQLVPQSLTPEQKSELVVRCYRERGEGVMIKDRNASYRAGRGTEIRKLKFTKTADLVVGELGIEGKNNATLLAYHDGERVEVGRCSLNGKPKVHPGDVVEVRYLYLGANQRLVQPTLLRVRDDKPAAECSFDQLELTNKQVLR